MSSGTKKTFHKFLFYGPGNVKILRKQAHMCFKDNCKFVALRNVAMARYEAFCVPPPPSESLRNMPKIQIK